MGSRSEPRFLQELALYAASAALSCLALFVALRSLDPNRAASKKAAEQKKEIAKRLGRPLIQTNAYEVEMLDSHQLFSLLSLPSVHTFPQIRLRFPG